MSERILVGDAIEWMQTLPDESVDMVLTDPPYGMTACKWDSVIPLDPMWAQLKRLIKPCGAIVMTASQPFTTTLISSNMKMFKYCWVWVKTRATRHVHAKNKPMKRHEDVCVFSDGTTVHANQSLRRMTYNPQGLVKKSTPTIRRSGGSSDSVMSHRPSHRDVLQEYSHYPSTVVTIASESRTIHPTQKPVDLMEYLIKTYTNEGETVLDFAMGSGTTGVACKNLKRSFIGIELNLEYAKMAKKRIAAVEPRKRVKRISDKG